MTRPISYGNNNLGSRRSFFEKKVYYEEVFPEDLIPNHISLWDKNRMYGKVNANNEVVALRESVLSPLRATAGGAAMFAPNFVAAAAGDLIDKIKACTDSGQIIPRGPFANIKIARGWSSLNQEYDSFVKSQIFATFVEQFLIFENQSKKIKNFSGFLEVFGGFSKHLAKYMPFTRTGFMESTFCSPYVTGLIIDIAIEDYSDDFVKSVDFINDPNFMFFADSAKQFGFMIDRNAPWRLVANLNSTAMQNYARKSGIQLTNDKIENIAIIQETLYKRIGPVDMNILAAYLKDMYNAYVERNPYIFEQIIKGDRRCVSASRIYKREQIGDEVIDESLFAGEYRYRWALRSFYYLRSFERNIKNSLVQDKKNLRFLYDILVAYDIQSPQANQSLSSAERQLQLGYEEAIKTLEGEIIGPFSDLPLPTETQEEEQFEEDVLPNY